MAAAMSSARTKQPIAVDATSSARTASGATPEAAEAATVLQTVFPDRLSFLSIRPEDEWQEAELRIQEIKDKGGDGLMVKAPSGYPIQNPYLAIANRAMEDCYKYLQQFGLSPAARTRVSPGVNGDLFDDQPGKNYFT